MNLFIVLFPVLVAVSLVYTPAFWVGVANLADYYTPWKILHSPTYEKYHNFLVSKLSDKEEIPLPEITAAEATIENVRRLTKDFTFPLVIRGLLGNESEGVREWHNHDWWIERYGEEELLCGTLGAVVEDCTVRGFFEAFKAGNPFYISGASKIFDKHPELHEMIDNDAIRAIEPMTRTATQVFIGFAGMGSDIHSAIGINLFRQVAGRKKWWFIPPSETHYLWPAINVNGFSAHTNTKVGKGNETASPWLKKLTRYTSIVGPGDVLINPPWFWHGIENLGEPGELIIGSPTRYGGGAMKPALKSNWMYTINSGIMFLARYGTAVLKPGFKFNLQDDIANNRRDREGKQLKEVELHPFDKED